MIGDDNYETILNNNPNLDILKKKLTYLDSNFYSNFNISCNYYSENEFTEKFSTDDRIIILNSNIQSLNGKFQDLLMLIQQCTEANINIEIITLQECWDIIDENAFKIPGFKFFHNSRKLGKRGGVAIYVKDYLKPYELPEKSIFLENIFESLVLEITLPFSNKKTFIGTFYRPNTHKILTSTEQINRFYDALSLFLEALNSKPSYICPDCNINLLTDNTHSTDLNNLLIASGFFNVITKATRFHSNGATAIDHIYTNIINHSYTSGVLTDNLSDHMLTFITIEEQAKTEIKTSYINYRPITQENIERFRLALTGLNWRSVTEVTDTNLAFEIFNNIFFDLFNLYLPEKRKKINKNKTLSGNLCLLDIGVLQGSILGVLLFLVYINDLLTCTSMPTFMVGCAGPQTSVRLGHLCG